MSDNKKTDDKATDDTHELTFESGYGAQDKVLKNDETLEEVAGVSEEAIRNDVRKTEHGRKKSDATESNKGEEK